MNLSKIYTILAVSFPILQLYGIGLSTVSVADLFLLLLYPFLIARNRWNNVSWPFLFYVFSVCIVGFFIHPQESLLKVLRYFCYILSLALFSGTFFIFEYGVRVFSKLVVFSTVFLFFQYFCYSFIGVYVPGYLPGLPIMRSELLEFSSLIGTDGGDERVRSIFGEPAHYAQYVVGYIAIIVTSPKRNMKILFLLFLGVLLSGSSTGVIACIFLLIVLLFQIDKIRLKAYVWYFFFLIGGGCLYLISHSAFYERAIEKLSDERSIAGRFSGIDTILSNLNYTNMDFLFGHGIGSINIFLPGYLMLFYYMGLFCLLTYFLANIVIYLKLDKQKRILLLLFALLNIGTEVVMGPFIVLFFSFILSKKHFEYDT